MKRKLIKQAGKAFTVTLPIEWIRENGLDENSEVDLEVLGKSVVIKTQSSKGVQKINLDTRGMSNRIQYQAVCALYVKGYDEIEILFDDNLSKNIYEIVSNTFGFIIVSQDKNKIIIKDLNSGNYSHLDEIFKRVFQIILLFLENAIEDIFGKEEEKLDNLKRRDIEVNKFCLYLQRAINKNSYPDAIKGRTLFTYSYELEKISDEIERFWRTNIKYSPKKNEDVKKLAKLALQGLEKSFDSRYSIDKKAISEIYEIREKIRENSLKIKINDPHSIRMIRHIVKIVEDAADLNPLNLMMKD